MATLKELKRRITSAKNSQKITKAMKLVSASKFSKANLIAKGSEPYGSAIDDLIKRLSSQLGNDLKHPLLQKREEKRILVLAAASDRGLCGALNSNVMKKIRLFADQHKSQEVSYLILGKKLMQFANKNKFKVLKGFDKILDRDQYLFAKELSEIILQKFESEEVDSIYLIYPKFENALTQSPVLQKLLPAEIDNSTNSGESRPTASSSMGNYIFEPGPEQLFSQLIRDQLVNKVYRVLLNEAASEHGARMTAMDNATNNAGEVIKKLTLVYNRGRQAAITKELIEITSGAEAL